jgi:hypothetical protein
MHSLPPWLALSAALLPTATAFYPYQYGDDSATSNSRRTVPSSPFADSNTRSLTLPIRRVPTFSSLRPRQNNYNIVNSKDPKQANSVAIDQDGGDLSYMVAVTIGDSKEEYHLLLDSAASNTWVMGQDCSSEACKTHNTFGKGDSKSLKVHSPFFLNSTPHTDTFADPNHTLQHNLRHWLRLRHSCLGHPTYRPALPVPHIWPRNQRIQRIQLVPHGRHPRHRPRHILRLNISTPFHPLQHACHILKTSGPTSQPRNRRVIRRRIESRGS